MSNAAISQQHNQVITDQFTRQAVPFAQLHSDDDSVRLLMETVRPSSEDNVLDVACGPGLVACAFAAVAKHATGIDLTPAMIEQAQRLQASRKLTNVTWEVSDVSFLPFASAAFTVVVSRYAMHHLLDPARVIAEMSRVCAPRGHVVVADVVVESTAQGSAYDAMEKLRDPSHVRALQLNELQSHFTNAGLVDLQTQFYRFGVDVEVLLNATRTPSDQAAQFRQIVADDIGHNWLGIDAGQSDGVLQFSFPLMIVSGRKSG